MIQKQKDTLLFGVFALLVICLRYPLLAIATHTFFEIDWSVFCQPVAEYNKAELLAGRIPTWCPLLNCGVPYLAQWNTLVCYPGILFYLLLPTNWGLNLFQLFHAAWGAVGMYLLARRLNGDRHLGAAIIGLSYELNGVCLSVMNWPQNLSNYAWVPWVIFLQLKAAREGRQWIAWAGVANGLHLLTGLPEFNLITWTFSAALGWAENHGDRRLSIYGRRWVTTVALGFAIAAIQLIPTAVLISTNSDPTRGSTNAEWALDPSGLINFIYPAYDTLPGAFTDRPKVQIWMPVHYTNLGLTALALAAAWRYRSLKLVLAITGVGLGWTLLAGGWLDPMTGLVIKHLPVISRMRYPIKFLLGSMIAIHLLACLYWREEHKAVRLRALALTILLPLGAVGLALLFEWLSQAITVNQSFTRLALHVLCGVLLVGLLFVRCPPFRVFYGPGHPKGWTPNFHGENCWVAVAAGLVLLGNSYFASREPNPMVPVAAYASQPIHEFCASNNLVPPRPEEGRLCPGAAGFKTKDPAEYVRLRRFYGLANASLPEGLSKVDGFVSVGPRQQELWGNSLITVPAGGESGRTVEGMLNFCAVKLQVNAQQKAWVPRSNAMDLVSIGQDAILNTNAVEALKFISSTNFNPRHQVFLDLGLDLERAVTSEPDRGAKARLTSFAADRWLIDTEASHPTLLVISQTWYPGWRATVNGKPAEILRANVAFQAVEVPAGKSVVELRYTEPGLKAGALISGVSLAGCLVYIGHCRGRRRTELNRS